MALVYHYRISRRTDHFFDFFFGSRAISALTTMVYGNHTYCFTYGWIDSVNHTGHAQYAMVIKIKQMNNFLAELKKEQIISVIFSLFLIDKLVVMWLCWRIQNKLIEGRI